MTPDRSRLVREGRHIFIQLDQLTNRALAAAGVTGVQARALLAILEQPENGTSVTALHQNAGCSKATVSNLVKQLREKGYVRSEPCARDDRCRLIFATEEGQRLQGVLEQSIQGAEDALYRDFSDKELSDLEHLQHKMLQNLSAYETRIQREVSAS